MKNKKTSDIKGESEVAFREVFVYVEQRIKGIEIL